MPFAPTVRCMLLGALAVLTMAAWPLGEARAQGYDFSRFLSGGGGGQDPKNKKIVTSMGAHICMGISPGPEPGSVRFALWSRIPQANSRIGAVAFDLGRHQGLLRNVAFALASPGVTATVAPGQTHAFLPGLTPEFWVQVPNSGHHRPEGLGPGRMLVLTAGLGAGKSIRDVLTALHEGFTQSSGLRIGVIVYYMLGGPPPGVGTIQDDGGFLLTRPSPACK